MLHVTWPGDQGKPTQLLLPPCRHWASDHSQRQSTACTRRHRQRQTNWLTTSTTSSELQPLRASLVGAPFSSWPSTFDNFLKRCKILGFVINLRRRCRRCSVMLMITYLTMYWNVLIMYCRHFYQSDQTYITVWENIHTTKHFGLLVKHSVSTNVTF